MVIVFTICYKWDEFDTCKCVGIWIKAIHRSHLMSIKEKNSGKRRMMQGTWWIRKKSVRANSISKPKVLILIHKISIMSIFYTLLLMKWYFIPTVDLGSECSQKGERFVKFFENAMTWHTLWEHTPFEEEWCYKRDLRTTVTKAVFPSNNNKRKCPNLV